MTVISLNIFCLLFLVPNTQYTSPLSPLDGPFSSIIFMSIFNVDREYGVGSEQAAHRGNFTWLRFIFD